jgi:hypothetical protein
MDTLLTDLCSSYVRRENRFYHVESPNEPLSRRDIEQAFISTLPSKVPIDQITSELLKQVFGTGIERKHNDRARTIAVWGGSMACHPGNPNRIIWKNSGTVSLNTWKPPTYRQLGITEATYGLFETFFNCVFPREHERTRILDWLAYCLQKEDRKPAWALLLYSKEKGTGKSTFCDLARTLFGPENTATQNNVDKLTSRFNSYALTNRLVISEELSLRPDSMQSNALKTYITDKVIATERKGREAEQVPLVSCFLFTTNHIPTFLEKGERRYYIVDTDHPGYASGPRAAEFSTLVGQVVNALADPVQVAGLYNALMARKLSDEFDGQTLNTERHGTELMKRIQGAAEHTNIEQLKEFLAARKCIIVTQSDAAEFVTSTFRVSTNATRHMMMELGWTHFNVKWGGAEYARVLWAKPGHWVADGNIYNSEGLVTAICDYLPATEVIR